MKEKTQGFCRPGLLKSTTPSLCFVMVSGATTMARSCGQGVVVTMVMIKDDSNDSDDSDKGQEQRGQEQQHVTNKKQKALTPSPMSLSQ